MPLLPLTGVHHRSPMNFSQDITNYTAKGREKIHKQIECISQFDFIEIARTRDPSETIEFNDNMMSAYAVQQGNCYISGNRLKADNMICIRKIPRNKGGTDSHRNIAFMDKIIGTAVMTDSVETARKLLKRYTLDSLQIKKLNRLRNNYGYHAI